MKETKEREKYNETQGITLVDLVTIVVLLILAGITLTYVFGDNSVFKQASEAKLKTEVARAKEKIEVVLTSVQVEKQTNQKYNENDFLDAYISNEIKDIEIIDEIIIVDSYAFELDRSIPKLGEYIGKKEELVFPNLTVSPSILAEDFRTATFTITAKEEKSGIYKIEVIQEGHVIEKYEYNNRKDEIIENCSVKQNGKYTIKAYANLSTIKVTTVDGIVMSVEYNPNGNKEYKKEHQVKVSVKETEERVKSIKYQWLNTTQEPTESSFTENCSNNDTIIGRGVTGTHYLWCLIETESGKTNICRSEGFYFDNRGPTVTLTSIPVSESSFTLTATASDGHSELAKCKFYINGELKETKDIREGTASYTVTGANTGNTSCYVIVTDDLENETKKTVTGKTKLYTWNRFTTKNVYKLEWTLTNPNYSTTMAETNVTRHYLYGDRSGAQATAQGKIKVSCSSIYFELDGLLNKYYYYGSDGEYDSPVKVIRFTSKGKGTLNGFSCYEYPMKGEEWTIKSVVDYKTKGDASGTVTATQRNTYPDNGASGSYWYVYKGIE